MSMLIPRISSASLEELNFGVTLSTLLLYATRRGIHTSPHLSMLGKSFANVEGSVRELALELSMVDVFEERAIEIVEQVLRRHGTRSTCASRSSTTHTSCAGSRRTGGLLRARCVAGGA
jgi:predicted unusual protein kinase regulating ubiquinone biosynthesis (AarF/ABC1/UbiB family)